MVIAVPGGLLARRLGERRTCLPGLAFMVGGGLLAATAGSFDVAPSDPAAMFLVREPWPSVATGAAITSGKLGPGDVLLVVSRMNEGGVVFADGMEGDRLDFAWGRTLRVSVSDRQLRFVPGAARPSPPAPPPGLVRRRAPPAPAAARVAAPPKPVTKPAARRGRLQRHVRWWLPALLGLSWLAHMLVTWFATPG
jgi:hypothetical protein